MRPIRVIATSLTLFAIGNIAFAKSFGFWMTEARGWTLTERIVHAPVDGLCFLVAAPIVILETPFIFLWRLIGSPNPKDTSNLALWFTVYGVTAALAYAGLFLSGFSLFAKCHSAKKSNQTPDPTPLRGAGHL